MLPSLPLVKDIKDIVPIDVHCTLIVPHLTLNKLFFEVPIE